MEMEMDTTTFATTPGATSTPNWHSLLQQSRSQQSNHSTPTTTHQIPTSTSPSTASASLTKPSASIPERKPKLRASCDACAASKVKCSKDHPICLRCSTNGSVCIYGLSRKHGKAGRVRRKNPDGTTATPASGKPSKQRPSPNGKEFGKFRIRPEPLLPDVADDENAAPSNLDDQSWSGVSVSSAGLSVSTTSAGLGLGVGGIDLGMDTDAPMQSHPQSATSHSHSRSHDSGPSLSFMDDILFANTASTSVTSQSYPSPTTPEFGDTIKPELTFKDPFAKNHDAFPRFNTPLPSDFQALREFIGGDNEAFNYSLHDEHTMFDNSSIRAEEEEPQSPRGSGAATSLLMNNLQSSITMPESHCCYSLAYATLESLHLNKGSSQPGDKESHSLDTVLATTKAAVRNVLQLLSCPCANSPHLAMLYASITSKILSWYQIAGGLQLKSTSSLGVMPPTPALSTASSPPSIASSSSMSSTVSSPHSTSYPIKLQPLRIGVFEFDEEDQDALRRQVVVRELRKCSVLVEALANWRSPGGSGPSGYGEGEGAEFLYDVLGAWLKSELFRTVREVGGERDE